MSCQPNIPMFARFLDSATPLPLTPRQKFILAARNVSDPFNLLTIGGVSAHQHRQQTPITTTALDFQDSPKMPASPLPRT